MLQKEEPKDYVISTGETHSIKELLQTAFSHVGIDDWEKYIEIDPRFKRPAELHTLCGNCSKAEQELGWKRKVGFEDLVKIMLDADMARLKDEK